MMTEEQAVALGKRAVAAGWKWQPGAVDTGWWRCICVDTTGAWGYGQGWKDPELLLFEPGDIPDFRDPATLGILRAQVIALVQGAVDVMATRSYGASVAVVTWVGLHGEPIAPGASVDVSGFWHIEALVTALEAARAWGL